MENNILEIFKNRFYKYLEKKDSCWEWINHINKTGYGAIIFENKKIGAHRASWLIHYGEIPKELYVLHRCDNRKCVNPEHLFLGTAKDNMRDMIEKGRRLKKGKKTSLSFDNVKKIRELLTEKNKHFDIAKIFDVSRQTITAINNYQNWKGS